MKPIAIRLKRVYEPPSTDDGYRVLIDRLWPPGIARDAPRWDRWACELAPSGELRHLYAPGRFDEFARRYRAELASHRDELKALRRSARAGRLTILFSGRDPAHSSAAVLAEMLGRADARDGTATIGLTSREEAEDGDETAASVVVRVAT